MKKRIIAAAAVLLLLYTMLLPFGFSAQASQRIGKADASEKDIQIEVIEEISIDDGTIEEIPVDDGAVEEVSLEDGMVVIEDSEVPLAMPGARAQESGGSGSHLLLSALILLAMFGFGYAAYFGRQSVLMRRAAFERFQRMKEELDRIDSEITS